MYGLSPSGWMDGEIFADWLERHFLLYAPASRPLLLLLDGHSSHYMADVVRMAASKGVILFCLPPNTTHATQPLDKTCFHALKQHWDSVVNAYMTANPGRLVTVYTFNQLFHTAWDKAMIPNTIRSGFKATGVYPVNRHAVKIPGERSPARKSVGIEDIAKSNGISYLPLYSPHTSQKHVSFASSPDVFSPPTSWSPLSPLSPQVSSIRFTADEERRFQIRYEEGYDIPDARYDQWLQTKHPEALPERRQLQFSPSSDLSSEYLFQEEHGEDSPVQDDPPPEQEMSATNTSRRLKLNEFVQLPTPPPCRGKKKPGEARVLTSADFLLELDKKEAEKKKQTELKEERKKVRLEKAAARAASKAAKTNRTASVKKAVGEAGQPRKKPSDCGSEEATDPREQVEEKEEDSKVSKTQPITQPKRRLQRPKVLPTGERAEDISENIVGSQVQQKSQNMQTKRTVSRISSRTRAQLAARKKSEQRK